MSLVANYTDSEEEDSVEAEEQSEREKDPKTNETTKSQISNTNYIIDDNGDESGANNSQKSFNFLGGFEQQSDTSDDGNSPDSDLEECDETSQKKRKFEKPLDNPFRYFGSGNVAAEDSVLRVEFREQEAHKTAVLERHVKMSSMAGSALTINGKKICWNHRKGKCRFGHNCKFAHDSDILPTNPDGSLPEKNFEPICSTSVAGGTNTLASKVNPLAPNDEEDIPAPTVVFASSAHLSGDSGSHTKRKKTDEFGEDEVGDSKNSGKKKRPGLSSGLVPGKKAMNMYYKTKTS